MVEKNESLYDLIKSGKLRVTVTTSPPEHRFWKKVDKNGPIHPTCGQCWSWTGGLSKRGYGQFMVGRRGLRSHRYSYTLHVGRIPNGLSVLHKCDNRSCVNPDHLFVGTTLDNQRDKVLKCRQAKGETNGSSKLTEAQALEIKARYKRESYRVSNSRELAKEYGVCRATIVAIGTGQVWKHLT